MKPVLPVVSVLALTLCIAACKKTDEGVPRVAGSQPAAADVTGADVSSNSAAAVGAENGQPAPDAAASPEAPQLAMAYKLGLVLPADQVRPLMESHQEACERAGTNQCQVLAADATAEGKDRASAELTLRATPAWMRMFRSRAEADAKDLGGKVQGAGTEGDDLSGTIVDTEAAQHARAAELERLTQLMQRHTKDLDQTLAVEKEITRVQGDMDQASSQLAAMRNRVVMQTVTVSYESKAMVAPDGITAPLAEAGRTFLGNVIAVMAALLTVSSYLLPFGLAGGLVWWGVRGRKGKAAAAPGRTPPAA
ncbi:MAG: DUF4349 domain-containing protein [Caulobacterales bacterium]